jgi:hypothetical protein
MILTKTSIQVQQRINAPGPRLAPPKWGCAIKHRREEVKSGLTRHQTKLIRHRFPPSLATKEDFVWSVSSWNKGIPRNWSFHVSDNNASGNWKVSAATCMVIEQVLESNWFRWFLGEFRRHNLVTGCAGNDAADCRIVTQTAAKTTVLFRISFTPLGNKDTGTPYYSTVVGNSLYLLKLLDLHGGVL